MKVLQRRANQKEFTKLSRQIKKNDAIDETEHAEPTITDNPVINEPSYFNLFKCGKNILNRLDATRKRACMETSRDMYYTEIFRTLTY